MAENFYLDPDGVALAADVLKQISENLDVAYKDFESTLVSFAGCWGDDDFGNSFATNYVPGETKALDNMAMVASSLETSEENIRISAKHFAGVDDETAEKIDEIAAEKLGKGK